MSIWEKQEIDFLKDHYDTLPMWDLSKHLKNRTDNAIHRKAHLLGITGNRYGLNNFTSGSSYIPGMEKSGKSGSRPPVKGRKKKTTHRRWSDQRYKTKNFNPAEMKPVRVDHKTVIYVPATATSSEIEVIKTKYQRKP